MRLPFYSHRDATTLFPRRSQFILLLAILGKLFHAKNNIVGNLCSAARFDSIFHSRFLASHVLIGWRQFYLQFGSELEWKSRVHFRLTLLTDINYRSKNFAYWSHFSWHCQLADNSWALCEKLRDSVNNISSRLVNLSQSFWFIICLREKNSSSVKLNLKFDGNSFSHWSVVSRQRYNKMRRKY